MTCGVALAHFVPCRDLVVPQVPPVLRLLKLLVHAGWQGVGQCVPLVRLVLGPCWQRGRTLVVLRLPDPLHRLSAWQG